MPEGFEIRQATRADLPAVQAIVRDAYAVYVPRLGREPSTMREDYAAHIAAGSVWVLEAGGGVAAVLVMQPAADHLYVDNVAVDPQRQGQGLGRRLLGFAEQHARRAGLPELRLTTNPHMTENLAMYAHLGFRETGRSQDGVLAFVHLRKAIG